MYMLVAIIRPERLGEVRQALAQEEIHQVTVTRCAGHGKAHADPAVFRGRAVEPELTPKVRLDIALSSDDWLAKAVKAIRASGSTSTQGDGKIFVMELKNVVRISDGTEGGEAI